MARSMGRLGVGLPIALITLAYAALALALHRAAGGRPGIPFLSGGLGPGIGLAMIAVGGAWYGWAALVVMRAYGHGKLATGGPYALCRHPIYAAWLLLIGPGAVLAWIPSCIMLTVPVVGYVAFRLLIAHEEASLEGRFGDAYRSYREQVRLLVPRPPGRRRGRQ